jgi:hypothetical protein
VARDHDSEGVLSECIPHRPRRPGVSDAPREFPVGHRGAERNRVECTVDPLLKRCAGHPKRQSENATPAGEVLLKLPTALLETTWYPAFRSSATPELHTHDPTLIPADAEGAKGG